MANQTTFAYDALGRLTTEANPLGTFTYGYDGQTRRLTSRSYPNGQTSLYSYYPNLGDRQLQTIHHKDPGSAMLSKFDFTYDVTGKVLVSREQAGAASPVDWKYSYDAGDELLSAAQWTISATPAVLKRYGYSYDPAENRSSEQIDDAVRLASHDSLNRLQGQVAGGPIRVAGTVSEPATVTIQGKPATVAGDNTFTGIVSLTAGTNTFIVTAVDASANTRTQTYSIDTTGPTQTYSYDGNGNLTSDGGRSFEWDAANRLVAVSQGTHRSEFTYDGFSRRVRIVEKDNGVATRDAQLVWDRLDLVEERLSTGEVNRFFDAGEQLAGNARYLTRDRLLSVREVTDGAGAVVTRNDYDPYGRLTRVAGTEDSRFGYTGHYNHPPTALALAPYRGYDAGLGRWLSEDPIGPVDGPNLYAYVRNAPTSAIDPRGLQEILMGQLPPWLDPMTAAGRQPPMRPFSGTPENPMPRTTLSPPYDAVPQNIEPPGEQLLGEKSWLAQLMEKISNLVDTNSDAVTTQPPDTTGQPPDTTGPGQKNGSQGATCPTRKSPPPGPACRMQGGIIICIA